MLGFVLLLGRTGQQTRLKGRSPTKATGLRRPAAGVCPVMRQDSPSTCTPSRGAAGPLMVQGGWDAGVPLPQAVPAAAVQPSGGQEQDGGRVWPQALGGGVPVCLGATVQASKILREEV